MCKPDIVPFCLELMFKQNHLNKQRKELKNADSFMAKVLSPMASNAINNKLLTIAIKKQEYKEQLYRLTQKIDVSDALVQIN